MTARLVVRQYPKKLSQKGRGIMGNEDWFHCRGFYYINHLKWTFLWHQNLHHHPASLFHSEFPFVSFIGSIQRSTENVSGFRQIGGEEPRGSSEPSVKLCFSVERWVSGSALRLCSPWLCHRQPCSFRSIGLFSWQTEPPSPKVHYTFLFSDYFSHDFRINQNKNKNLLFYVVDVRFYFIFQKKNVRFY